MYEQRIKYRGSYSYNKITKQGYYQLFDFVTNKSEKRVTINNTTEADMIKIFGAAQREYYEKYPRFLPKGINLSNDHNFNFQLNLLTVKGQTIFLGKYLTIQDAIKAKKEIIALNIE